MHRMRAMLFVRFQFAGMWQDGCSHRLIYHPLLIWPHHSLYFLYQSELQTSHVMLNIGIFEKSLGRWLNLPTQLPHWPTHAKIPMKNTKKYSAIGTMWRIWRVYQWYLDMEHLSLIWRKKSFRVTFCGLRFFPTFCQISLAKNSFYATEVTGHVNCILNINGLGFIPELFPQVWQWPLSFPYIMMINYTKIIKKKNFIQLLWYCYVRLYLCRAE